MLLTNIVWWNRTGSYGVCFQITMQWFYSLFYAFTTLLHVFVATVCNKEWRLQNKSTATNNRLCSKHKNLHWWRLLAERCGGRCQRVGTADSTTAWRLSHVWLRRRQHTSERRHCLNWWQRCGSGSVEILHKRLFCDVQRLRLVITLLSVKQSTTRPDGAEFLWHNSAIHSAALPQWQSVPRCNWSGLASVTNVISEKKNYPMI